MNSLYNKLKGVEPQVARALVRESNGRLAPVIQALRAELPPLLPGYRVKILDGNHLAATEHRVKETRVLHIAPLPGESLVLLDPQLRLLVDVIPCEDAYAQEREWSTSRHWRSATRTSQIPSVRSCGCGGSPWNGTSPRRMGRR